MITYVKIVPTANMHILVHQNNVMMIIIHKNVNIILKLIICISVLLNVSNTLTILNALKSALILLINNCVLIVVPNINILNYQ